MLHLSILGLALGMGNLLVKGLERDVYEYEYFSSFDLSQKPFQGRVTTPMIANTRSLQNIAMTEIM